jgi:hypothetical protein
VIRQAVSNSLWAYAKLGYNPGILLLDVAAQKAAGMLHQYTSQELANTVWALATLEHHPGAAMLNSAATQIARRMDQFSTQVPTSWESMNGRGLKRKQEIWHGKPEPQQLFTPTTALPLHTDFLATALERVYVNNGI